MNLTPMNVVGDGKGNADEVGCYKVVPGVYLTILGLGEDRD